MKMLLDATDATAKDGLIAGIRRLVKGIFEISVTKKTKRRTRSQNALLWAHVYPHVAEAIADVSGEKIDIDQAHYLMKMRFNYLDIINTTTRETFRVPKTTTKLSIPEFSAYVENIIRFCSELNYVVPTTAETLVKQLRADAPPMLMEASNAA